MSQHEPAPLHGAMFSTAATLGHAESNTLGPTAGNGFRNRWVDDLAHLSEHGISTVRVTLDWSRLQPRPGSIDAGWVEFYGSLLDASRALGSQTWVCLHEAGVPKWFDNEGGFGDDDAAAKWWPRWVEAAAEHFGDRVAGWIPFLTPPSSVASVWSDTWSIVGGNAPVVRSFRLPDDRDSLPDDNAEATHLGLSLSRVDDDRSSDHHDGALEAERIGTLIRDLAEHSAALPIVVTNAEHPQHATMTISVRRWKTSTRRWPTL